MLKIGFHFPYFTGAVALFRFVCVQKIGNTGSDKKISDKSVRSVGDNLRVRNKKFYLIYFQSEIVRKGIQESEFRIYNNGFAFGSVKENLKL